jgi:hypothetical protein
MKQSLIQRRALNQQVAVKIEMDGPVIAPGGPFFCEVPVLMNNVERVKFIRNRLQSKQVTRAKKRATLESQIQTLFGKALTELELKETINGLIARKAIEITATGEVIYQL